MHLEQLDGTKLPNIHLSPIFAGAINQNFLLSVNNRRYLLKSIQYQNSLSIERSDLFELQRQLASKNLAAEPIAWCEKNQVYIEQWLEDLTLSREHNNNTLVMLAKSLSRIHSLKINAPRLNLDEHWNKYQGQFLSDDEGSNRQIQTMQGRLSSYLDFYKKDFVFCHNDLHLEHLCTKSGRILDWEYSGVFCRYFDLASCILINGFSDHATANLLKHYANFQNKSYTEVQKGVQASYDFVSYTNDLWSKAVNLNC